MLSGFKFAGSSSQATWRWKEMERSKERSPAVDQSRKLHHFNDLDRDSPPSSQIASKDGIQFSLFCAILLSIYRLEGELTRFNRFRRRM